MPNDPTGTPGTGFPRSPSWTVTIVIALVSAVIGGLLVYFFR